MPILPAIVTAGLLMGINNLLGAKDLFLMEKFIRCVSKLRRALGFN